jgi:hypothetical protein
MKLELSDFCQCFTVKQEPRMIVYKSKFIMGNILVKIGLDQWPTLMILKMCEVSASKSLNRNYSVKSLIHCSNGSWTIILKL